MSFYFVPIIWASSGKQDVPGLSYNFFSPTLESYIFFKEHSALGVFISAGIPLSYVYTQKHTHPYTCGRSISVSPSVEKHEFWYLPYYWVRSHLLAIFVTFFSDGEKLVFIILNILIYLSNDRIVIYL